VGDGTGVGGGVGGGTQRSTTACGSICAATPVGGEGGGCTVRDTTAVRADVSPLTFDLTAARTSVPAVGSGSVSTRVSPGATRRIVRRAPLAKSPGPSMRSSSTSSTPRRSPPAVTRGALKLTSSCAPRWASLRSPMVWGTRDSGGWGSPRLPQAGEPRMAVEATSQAMARRKRKLKE
jgi:hypothetical protein